LLNTFHFQFNTALFFRAANIQIIFNSQKKCIFVKLLKNMAWYNFHTHTNYCDGTDIPEDYVRAAIVKNISHIGFSGHAPVPFPNKWSTSYANMAAYCSDIRQLSEKYAGIINVYLGLEADYIPEVTSDFSKIKKEYDLDYIIGGIHYVRCKDSGKMWFLDGPEANYDYGLEDIFGGDIKKAISAYFAQSQEMLFLNRPDVIAHADKITMNNRERFFQTHEKWYREHLENLVKTIAQLNVIVEINTRGCYKGKHPVFFPDAGTLELCKAHNVPITISSDAHSPSELCSLFPEAYSLAYEIGYRKLAVFTGKEWEMKAFQK